MSFFVNTLRSSVHPLLPLHNPLSPGVPSRSMPGSPGALPSPSLYRAPHNPEHGTNDVLAALARQTAHLERTLQSHLDAQSAGLLAGLDRPDDEAASTLETDPLARTSHTLKPLPLPRARRAIRTALLKLAETKAAEASELATAKQPLDVFLTNLDSLATRKAGLDARLEEFEGDDQGSGQLRALADEEHSLDAEVRALEDQLAERRARLRHVRQRREVLANRRDAELSSWRHASAEVEQCIADEVLSGRGAPDTSALRPSGFTSRRRESTARSASGRRSSSQGGSGSRRVSRSRDKSADDADTIDIWSLPPSRRTLDLVRSSLAATQQSAESRRAAAQSEAEACVQGADLWQGAVNAVRGVERALATELSRVHTTPATRPRSSPTPPASIGASTVLDTEATASFATARSRPERGASDLAPDNLPGAAGMRGVLHLMRRTEDALRADARLAQRRGWAPLVCAIGAELEAMREGRGVLERALGIGASTADGTSETQDAMSVESEAAQEIMDDSGGKGKELLFDAGYNDAPAPELLVEHNDEPAPDLLAEHDDEPAPDLLAEHNEENDGPSADLLFEHPSNTR